MAALARRFGSNLLRWVCISRPHRACVLACPSSAVPKKGGLVGSVIKKRRKRMAKKKHRKLLKKTRIQRRNKK